MKNFYPPIYKGAKLNKFFLKTKQFTIRSKTIASENTRSLYMEWKRIYFSYFFKKVKKYLLSLIMEWERKKFS